MIPDAYGDSASQTLTGNDGITWPCFAELRLVVKGSLDIWTYARDRQAENVAANSTCDRRLAAVIVEISLCKVFRPPPAILSDTTKLQL